jgi:hypothetical protein
MTNERERWKPCPGFEGVYAVSSLGRVKRILTRAPTKAGRIIKPHIVKRSGYAQIPLHNHGQHIRKLASLVCAAFHGPRPVAHEVNHRNGIRHDNRASNLEWTTKSENCLHRSRVLGNARGAKHGRAKLTEEDVLEIRRRLAIGELCTSIAKIYAVSSTAIRLIRDRKNWAHVP